MGNGLCSPSTNSSSVEDEHSAIAQVDSPTMLAETKTQDTTIIDDKPSIDLKPLEEKKPEVPKAEVPKVEAPKPADAPKDTSISKKTQMEMFTHHFGAKAEDDVGKLVRRPSTVGADLEQYVEKHKQKFADVLALESEAGWTYVKTVDGVSVYKKAVENSDFICFKGQTEMDFPKGMNDAVRTVLQAENRPQFDDMCTEGVTHQNLMPWYRVTQYFVNMPALFNPRETLTTGRACFMDDGAMVVSVENFVDPQIPIRAGYVRVKFIAGGYVFRPLNEACTKFRVTWTGSIDPQGWIPTWLANLVAPKQALTLAKLRVWLESKEKGTA